MEKVTYDTITKLLVKKVTMKIDRPLGSTHPNCGFLYLLNYGFIEGIMAPDGDELDAYLLGVFEPVKEYSVVCITIIHRTNDNDDKLIIAPDGVSYTDEQIRALTEFQERFFESVIVRS
jgi:inorganic pyrophosphatase